MTNSEKSLYWIFQYFEFEVLFTFENDKQLDVIVLNERDHVTIFLQRNYTILLQIAVAFNWSNISTTVLRMEVTGVYLGVNGGVIAYRKR